MRSIGVAIMMVLVSGVAHAGTAAETVEQFYRNPGSEIDPAYREHFAGKLRSFLFANDRAWDRHGEVCLDFVPSVDAQDFDAAEIRDTLRLTEVIGGGQTVVIAEFNLFGQDRTMEWTLIPVRGEWKVTDIASPRNGWRMTEMTCG